ncbi:hypothetical protein HY463_00215 [Candidatus Peregrinibacteria bacterium]|nr:hypothetical protein [Candidatus Peregrinibacteria bacterium]
MKNLYAVWIDHQRAFVVKANAVGDMTVTELTSSVEPHRKSTLTGGDQFTITNQNKQAHRRENEMHSFTKEVLSHITDADEIVICGPGTAKFDLRHELEHNKVLASKLKKMETCDKMTEAELKDFVKQTLHLPRE